MNNCLYCPKKINAIIILIFLIFSTVNFAQDTSRSPFWSNVRFGGGIGLSFGNDITSIGLSPTALYEFNNKFGLGMGLNFTYNSRKDYYKSTIFGGSIIGMYNPIPQIQTSLEFEELNIDRNFDSEYAAYFNVKDSNFWNSSLFVGLGYGSRYVSVGVRYDLLYDKDKSIYANPWVPFVRVFF